MSSESLIWLRHKGRLCFDRSYFLRLLSLSLVYAACAKIGLLFAVLHLNVSPVWPGSGVALAALFLGGKKLWPGIALGSLAADLTGGVPLLAALGNAAGSSTEAVVGAMLLVRLLMFSPSVRRTRDALLLAAVSVLAPLVGAAIGVVALVAARTIPVSEVLYNYSIWWFGDSLGCLLFAPLVFVAFKSVEWTWRNVRHAAMAIAMAGTVTSLGLFHFASYFPFTFILLTGIAIVMKLRQMGAAITSVTISAVSIWAVLSGAGNPADLTLNRAIIALQVATAVVAIVLLLLSTLLHDRDHDRTFLEAVLENLDTGVVACDADGKLTLFNRATRELHDLPEEPIPSEEWAEHYDLYRADGMTPLPMDEIPLYRALRGEQVRNAEMVIVSKNVEPRILVVNGRSIRDGGR